MASPGQRRPCHTHRENVPAFNLAAVYVVSECVLVSSSCRCAIKNPSRVYVDLEITRHPMVDKSVATRLKKGQFRYCAIVLEGGRIYQNSFDSLRPGCELARLLVLPGRTRAPGIALVCSLVCMYLLRHCAWLFVLRVPGIALVCSLVRMLRPYYLVAVLRVAAIALVYTSYGPRHRAWLPVNLYVSYQA